MTLRKLFHALGAPLVVVCAVALSSTPAAAAESTCPDTALAPAADNLPRIAASIGCLVNEERGRASLPQLALSPQLTLASQPMADAMVEQQFFSHDSPDGSTVVDRIRVTGYLPNSNRWVVGENLAWGSGALGTPQGIVDGWLGSPGHRANILAADYRDIGIGIAMGSPSPSHSGGATYVTDFGKRDPPRPARLAISVSRPMSSSAKGALAHGLTVRATCSRACTLVGRLFLHVSPAQAARLDATPPLAGSLRLVRAGHGTFKVRLSSAAKRALRRSKRLNMTLVTTAAGTQVMRMTRVTLR